MDNVNYVIRVRRRLPSHADADITKNNEKRVPICRVRFVRTVQIHHKLCARVFLCMQLTVVSTRWG